MIVLYSRSVGILYDRFPITYRYRYGICSELRSKKSSLRLIEEESNPIRTIRAVLFPIELTRARRREPPCDVGRSL
jgi:hypothetical protein